MTRSHPERRPPTLVRLAELTAPGAAKLAQAPKALVFLPVGRRCSG
jgi:hypothetical protein